MLQLLQDQYRWVKPFSSAMSCIDTVSTECERGKTVQECMDMCHNSKKCNYGYHVEMPNEKQSYCLPLNGLPHWGNPKAFFNSTIQPESSPIVSESMGVKVSAFYNPDAVRAEDTDDTNLRQLDIYLLRYRVDASRPSSDLYLLKDMKSFGENPNDALKVMVIRDLPVSSGISTTESMIRNGMLAFLKNTENNNVFLFLNESTFGFFPFTIRWSSSIAFNIEDLYHIQLIKEYPFYHDPMKIEETFAIRASTVPVGSMVYYWDMDTSTRELVMRKVSKEEMTNLSHLDGYKKFTFERIDKINIFQAENFVNSQSNYLYSTFPERLFQRMTPMGWMLLCVVVIVVMYVLIRIVGNS